MSNEWVLASLGNASGTMVLGERRYRVDAGRLGFSTSVADDPTTLDSFELAGSSGKLGDSEDSLLFFGTKVDLGCNNFTLSATLSACPKSSSVGHQLGFGLFVLDTLAPQSKKARHRNMLAAGCFRARRFDTYEYGVRAVAGHVAHDAFESGRGRRLDSRRVFEALPESPTLPNRVVHRFVVKKTDAGFTCSVDGGGNGARHDVLGCDFLVAQDASCAYVGIGVAGQVELSVSGLALEVEPGQASHTPNDEIVLSLPDYPFRRELVPAPAVPAAGLASADVLWAAPDGNAAGSGTREQPLDLQTALLVARPGSRVILADGTYRPTQPVVAPVREGLANVSVEAEHAGEAVVDGSCLAVTAPVMMLRGDNWRVSGLVFCNSPSSGLFVCGSDNVVERCEAHHNKDTGILICTFPGTGREAWPARNQIRSCVSHDNCDDAQQNADGFGAKLSVGEGNRFYRCIAHHNIDDGFDLYSKSVLGPTGAVVLEECVAYENGHLVGGARHRLLERGSGFKLGGENQPVAHTAVNCIAFCNDHKGFSTNSNPSARLSSLTSWSNGPMPAWHNLLVERRANGAPTNVLINSVSGGRGCEGVPADLFVSTNTSIAPTLRPDGTINMHGLFVRRREVSKEESLLGATIGGNTRSRLMFIVPRLSGGGAERVIASLASALSRDHDVTLVTTVKDDGTSRYDLSDRARFVDLLQWGTRGRRAIDGPGGIIANGAQMVLGAGRNIRAAIDIVRREVSSRAAGEGGMSMDERSLFLRAEWLRGLKRALGIDCAVSFLNSANYLNALSHGGERCVVSVRSHIDGPFAPAECLTEDGRQRIAFACQEADKVVAVSHELAHVLTREFDLPEGRVCVIQNGIDVDAVATAAALPLEDKSLDERLAAAGFAFVSVGRLTRKKGTWHIVRAFSRVVERHPDALLVLLGRPGKGDQDVSGLVERAARELGIQNNVVVAGFLKNPHQVVSRCDACVMASLNEGFPNALIEAMALGLPVVSTDCSSGPREILAPATDPLAKTSQIDVSPFGILVPPCSGEELAGEPLQHEEQLLARAMLMLVEDEGLRESLSKAAAARARELSYERFLSSWEEAMHIV